MLSNTPTQRLLRRMAHNRLHNYAMMGLTSSLIGSDARGELGRVRMFEASRTDHGDITPHSHRFDFTCLVLAGVVTNQVWRSDPKGEEYQLSLVEYHKDGSPRYTKKRYGDGPASRWSRTDDVYTDGEWYSMTRDQIHSIRFERGTVVLFFEGPEEVNHNKVLEPIVNGLVIDTLKVEPWMFQPDNATTI